MRYIISFFFVFLYWSAVGVVAQLPFCMIYLPDYSIADWMEVLWHGLRLDISIAGYLTMLAGLLLTIDVWWKGRGWQWVWNISYGIVAFASSLAYVSNLVLYGYWRFPLDSTPLLYIKTSPADAMASMTTWQMIYVPLVILACHPYISLLIS